MTIPPTPAPLSLRRLPAKPDLDQLKRQAKELLAAHQSGDAAATTTVRQFFTVTPDQTLTLAQAQLVLARSYGFDSWPKLKAHVEGVTRQRLVEAVSSGDTALVERLLRRRPEMAGATTGQGEQQLIHVAVLNNDEAMLRLLVELGADPRRGIWPHRESTSAYQMARERGLIHLVRAIEDVEAHRREAMSCPNVTVSEDQEKLAALIRAQRNDEAVVMLEADPSLIKQCDRDGGTPLHVACSCGNETMVDWLCDHRADARKPDIQQRTPIDRAVLSVGWRAHVKVETAMHIMRRLQRRGCETTSIAAAALGDIERLRQLTPQQLASLAMNGGDVFGNRGALLTRAVQFGQIDAVECLLDMGMDPNEPVPLGKASDDENAVSWGGPLWNAAAFGHLDIARLLLDRGADPNGNVYASGWPLDRAYERGDRAMIELLYARGANPTPWTVCAAHDVDAAGRLLDADGHDPQRVREWVWSAGCTVSLPIFRMALPRLLELADQLTDEQMNRHDLLCQPMRMGGPNDHVRPPHYCEGDRFTIMQMMLDGRLDPNARGRFGLTLLHFVAARDMPPEHRARFASQLLDAGADASLRDELLCSDALGWACRYGRVELVKLLLERGADPVEADAEPWATPRAWAEKMGHAAIVALLEGREASGTRGAVT